MQRLLTSLSNFLDRFIKKPSPVVDESEFSQLGGNPVGVFVNQAKTPLEYYITTILDEEANYYIRIQYMCACGEPVFKLMSDDYGFGCDHCDSECKDEICTYCHNLMSVDFGAPGGEEDSDI